MTGPPAPAAADDVARYRERLRELEEEARGAPWADRRPWRADTHVGWEGELPVVDLHDLPASLARRATRLVLEAPPGTGAVVLVHGSGRHTLGPSQVLRQVVHKELRRACADQAAWSFRTMGAARTVWISDRARAPRAALGPSDRSVGLLWLLLLLAFALAVVSALAGW